MDYVDNTFIKLKRQYSKDEVIQALYKKLSERDTEIGKLKAELDEGKYVLDKIINYKFKYDLLTQKTIESVVLNNRESRYKRKSRKKSLKIRQLEWELKEARGLTKELSKEKKKDV